MPRIPTDAEPTMRIKELLAFVVERHHIYRRKTAGQPKPWTTWPILQQYRFCNVYRELDTETAWIADHWREPHKNDPDLWFAMVVARFVNWHESLEAIGYPVPWCPDRFVDVLEERQRRRPKVTVFNPVYNIGNGGQSCPKAVYLGSEVLTPMWSDRAALRRVVRGTLAEASRALVGCVGMATFMAGQVIADLKYVEPLLSAKDWYTWAAPGPGSKRGLNRVLGRDVEAPWTEPTWSGQLQTLHRAMQPLVLAAKLPRIHAQDLQNCLCEFDKMERARLGQGKPKRRYPGGATD
jgi:hypothetical protein